MEMSLANSEPDPESFVAVIKEEAQPVSSAVPGISELYPTPMEEGNKNINTDTVRLTDLAVQNGTNMEMPLTNSEPDPELLVAVTKEEIQTVSSTVPDISEFNAAPMEGKDTNNVTDPVIQNETKMETPLTNSKPDPELLVAMIKQDVQTALSADPDISDSELNPEPVEQMDTNTVTDSAVQNGSNSSTGRQRLCEICEVAPSKYTCPGCELKTCSLSCVKDHKTKLNCSGERDKTAFVDKSQYSDRHLLNDYRFLEDAERRFYSNKRVPANRRHVIFGAPYYVTKRSRLLIAAALKRGVKLKMISQALSKNKTNSSFYSISSDIIDWHIEWHFVTTNTAIQDERVPETTTLKEAARKYTNFVQYPHLRKCLENYKKEKLDECRFLLKVEGLPGNIKKYFELKPHASITDNLKGHCLVEYPTILVVPSSVDDSVYSLLSKGDIAVMDPAFARHLANHFPQFDIQAAIESELLNPKSSVYAQ